MTTMTPAEARLFWKALMDNASSLIVDARTLLEADSHGRARSLTVLAQEELGKALWIYDTFAQSWSDGNDDPRSVDRLMEHGRNHTKKYLEAVRFGGELSVFWGDYSAFTDNLEAETWEQRHEREDREAERTARQANLDKQRGFYVDRDADGTLHVPTEIDVGSIPDDLQLAAQVVEMLLIKDHSRMKIDASTPYDDTFAEQFRLLPISHPEDWAAASEEFRSGGSRRDEEDQPPGD